MLAVEFLLMLALILALRLASTQILKQVLRLETQTSA